MYTFRDRVRYSETNTDGKLGIASIVNYFQDCSTFQSEELGVGIAYLKERHMLWVMSAWQIVVDRYPELCENIVVGTFPYEFRGFMGFRNFFIEDEAGRRIVTANSIWSLMDPDRGCPVRPTAEMAERYVLEPKLPMEYAPRKIRLEGEGCGQTSFVVGKQNLDGNHHVNNGQYIFMAQDYLPEGFVVGQMRAEYKKSALLHDRVSPMVYNQGEVIAVALNDGNGQPYAVIEFKER